MRTILNVWRIGLTVLLLVGGMASYGASLIDVAFTGASVTPKKGPAATGVSTNDFWNTCSGASLPDLEFVDGTLSGSGLTISGVYGAVVNDGAWDLMYASYLYNLDFASGHTITVAVTNLTAGTYNLYLYGHGTNWWNYGLFELSVGLESYGTLATVEGFNWNFPQWQEGIGFVEFTNVNVLSGQTVTITVDCELGGVSLISGLQIRLAGPPTLSPVIFTQPATQLILPGGTATFNVSANGQPPLAYQWMFNGAPVANATGTSLSVTNAQRANFGSYTVIVTNSYGGATSAPAALIINSPGNEELIDVAFTGGPVTAKSGFAATGLTTNDFWSSFTNLGGALPNVKFVDGTASGAGITVSGANGVYGNGQPDPMYSTYLYSSVGSMTVSVTNLIPGTYDLYLYGMGSAGQVSTYEITVGSQGYRGSATPLAGC
jgi:hypothetical protein